MSKTTSKPVPDSHRALITMSIVRAVPGNTSRARQNSMQGTVPSAQSLLILVGSAVVFGYLAVRFFRRVAAAYAAGRIQLDLVPVAVRSAERGRGLATADEPPRRSYSRPVRTRSVR